VLPENSALVIVDMQWYYLNRESSYCRYFEHLWPDSMSYIFERCQSTVIPNTLKLIDFFHTHDSHIIYLRLCGEDPERNDLHRFFKETFQKGRDLGFDNIYPLIDDPASQVIAELKPHDPGEKITEILKTTYSAFTSSQFEKFLRDKGIVTLVCTGLATSQCVETTARDASDRGFEIIHIEDAQADYDEISHNSSLYSSQGVCGGRIFDTESFITYFSTIA